MQNDKRCVNPWVGLLIIAGICAVIAAALFFEFEGPRGRQGAGSRRKGFAQGSLQSAAMTIDTLSPQESQDSIIF